MIGIASQADLALKDKPERVHKTVAEISKPTRPSIMVAKVQHGGYRPAVLLVPRGKGIQVPTNLIGVNCGWEVVSDSGKKTKRAIGAAA